MISGNDKSNKEVNDDEDVPEGHPNYLGPVNNSVSNEESLVPYDSG